MVLRSRLVVGILAKQGHLPHSPGMLVRSITHGRTGACRCKRFRVAEVGPRRPFRASLPICVRRPPLGAHRDQRHVHRGAAHAREPCHPRGTRGNGTIEGYGGAPHLPSAPVAESGSGVVATRRGDDAGRVGCTRSRPKPPWPPWTTERRWSAHPGWRRTSRGRPGPEPDRRHVDDHLQEPGALGSGLDSAPRRDEAASHLLIARRGPGDVHPAGARPRRVGEPAVIRHTQEADDAEADDGGSGGGIAGGLP